MVTLNVGWWRWVWGGDAVVSPDVTAMGTGEAELQPQEGERNPRGGVRHGQPHEGGHTGGWHCHLMSPPVPLCPLMSPHVPSQIAVAVELSVTGLEDAGDAITFHLQLRR